MCDGLIIGTVVEGGNTCVACDIIQHLDTGLSPHSGNIPNHAHLRVYGKAMIFLNTSRQFPVRIALDLANPCRFLVTADPIRP
jgi:hypothetical protein